MAERPIFVPVPDSLELVQQIPMRLTWHPGFAVSQKKKNIIALHEAAARAGYAPLLEVSTKSDEKVGQRRQDLVQPGPAEMSDAPPQGTRPGRQGPRRHSFEGVCRHR